MLWLYVIVTGFLSLGSVQALFAIEKVRLAVPVVAVMYAPYYFGIKQGIYGAEGVELDVSVARTDMALAALGTGQMDYLAHGGAALRAAARGFPLKLVYAMDDKAPFWLAARPDIERVEMLKGKKLGVSFPGDTPYLVLRRFLRKRGLDPDKDVIYVSGQFSPLAFQGLAAGALDAAVLAPPFSVLAQEKGLRTLAFLGKEVPDAPIIDGLVTSEKKIRSQPQQVKRMVRATLKSVQLYRQRRELSIPFLAAEFKLSHSTAQKVYQDALGILTRFGEVTHEKVRDVLEMARETGQDNLAIPSPESMLDFSFLKEVQRELAKPQ
ncbi:MAG: ABC transporter substrate-binding protein [Deltaproteobacteria bacterium]|nr:ABC transporter substrate-binding protein [Deltaproteobacteria bacterium]